MVTKNEIIEIIFQSIEDINNENDIKILKDINTKLFGSTSELDSILLVNLIVSVEENIEELSGKYIPIADERAFSLEESPFKNIGTLADHIKTLLNE
jgi:acyl carrier protein